MTGGASLGACCHASYHPRHIRGGSASPPAPAAAFAQTSDAARAPVQALCDGLIAIMKGGKAMGVRGRAAAIAPVVDRVYDVPLMTRLTVGAELERHRAG